MNKPDLTRDYCMLTGPLARRGYDWWWHSFTGYHEKTGEPRAFYVEYFVCNPDHAADAPGEPIIVWNDPAAQAAGKRPSYLMVNAGSWGQGKAQLHRFIPWSEVSLAMQAPLALVADDCALSETHLCGSVTYDAATVAEHPELMSDAASMQWDLQIDKLVAFNVGYGASKPFRAINAFQMFWHAEGMKTQYSGYVMWNGERYLVKPETSYGYADKNWGSDFTSPWVWLSSCNLTSKITGRKLANSVFDIGGGRPRVYGISLGRQLLGAFWYEGKNYEFNFSKLWTGCRTRFDCGETDDLIYWNITMTTFTAKLEIEMYCEKKDMIRMNYEAPDGVMRFHHLWNCGMGFGEVKLYEREISRGGGGGDTGAGAGAGGGRGDGEAACHGDGHGSDGRKLQLGWRLIDDMLADNVGCEYGIYD